MTVVSSVSNSRPKYKRVYVRDTMQQRNSAYKFIIIIIIIINDNLYSAVCTLRSTSRALIVHYRLFVYYIFCDDLLFMLIKFGKITSGVSRRPMWTFII
jgi:hypothetical protein